MTIKCSEQYNEYLVDMRDRVLRLEKKYQEVFSKFNEQVSTVQREMNYWNNQLQTTCPHKELMDVTILGGTTKMCAFCRKIIE